MNTNVAQNKACFINKILNNPTYLAESGLIGNLRKALNKLSVSDLGGLSVIIDCKIADVIRKERKLS